MPRRGFTDLSEVQEINTTTHELTSEGFIQETKRTFWANNGRSFEVKQLHVKATDDKGEEAQYTTFEVLGAGQRFTADNMDEVYNHLDSMMLKDYETGWSRKVDIT